MSNLRYIQPPNEHLNFLQGIMHQKSPVILILGNGECLQVYKILSIDLKKRILVYSTVRENSFQSISIDAIQGLAPSSTIGSCYE